MTTRTKKETKEFVLGFLTDEFKKTTDIIKESRMSENCVRSVLKQAFNEGGIERKKVLIKMKSANRNIRRQPICKWRKNQLTKEE